jgi:hypothetical protein
MLRNEYKTNHDMVPLPGIYNGLNFVVAHLAAAVLKEDGSTGTEVRITLKTRPDACNHASPTGQNLCWKSIVGSYLASGGGGTDQKDPEGGCGRDAHGVAPVSRYDPN